MEERAGATSADLTELAAAADAGGGGAGVVWKLGDGDRQLDVNLVHLPPGGQVGSHGNDQVDVLLVGVTGDAVVDCDGEPHRLAPGILVWVPTGTIRSIAAGGEGAAYLSAHRRRDGVTIGARRADRGRRDD